MVWKWLFGSALALSGIWVIFAFCKILDFPSAELFWADDSGLHSFGILIGPPLALLGTLLALRLIFTSGD